MTIRPKSRIQRMAVIVAILFGVRTAYAGTDPVLNKKLEDTIASIRMMAPSTLRFQASAQLAKLTHKVPPYSVSDATVNDLVSLLDDPDDAVRWGAAGALGNLGRRAKVAVPKLLALLPETDCLTEDLTSRATIRPALKRMGVRKLPPEPSYEDCKKSK